jgi:hypothetical protein
VRTERSQQSKGSWSPPFKHAWLMKCPITHYIRALYLKALALVRITIRQITLLVSRQEPTLLPGKV